MEKRKCYFISALICIACISLVIIGLLEVKKRLDREEAYREASERMFQTEEAEQ